MGNTNSAEKADSVYRGIVASLNRRNWRFKEDPENRVVTFGVSGNDLPVKLALSVDSEKELVCLRSPFTFKIKDDKRIDAIIAISVMNYALSVGAFSMNMSDGQITFVMTTSYKDSTLTEDVFESLIDISVNTVDSYNDRIFAINMGLLSVEDFMAQESND
ncbi:MAG: YbjN domain-containing protein [Lachnospiraceae bacterium]|nr:YbjN domain-containing protein [Lachnospiraceae bacterium]